jgi:hypothetical protein
VRWLEDVEQHVLEMKIKRWRHGVVDREEWASVIKEASALRRPYSQVVSVSKCVRK